METFGLFCPSLLDLSFFLLGFLLYSFLPEAEGLSCCGAFEYMLMLMK